MQFVKMNGIGNDYVFVDARGKSLKNPAALSVMLSNRNYSIGSDGLVVIEDSQSADCKMLIFNSDGSQAKMCGNAIRCVAKYMYDNRHVTKNSMDIQTLSGVKNVQITAVDGLAKLITVDMGIPKIQNRVPISGYDVVRVDVGNEHAVLFCDKLDDDIMTTLRSISNGVEGGINAEAIRIIDRSNIEMRVYERGSGETLACGTGATAAMFAAYHNGLVSDDVEVRLRGGKLRIKYMNGRLYMQGGAEVNFKGEVDIDG